MTTLNTIYRSRKFFLCVHQASKGMVGFEKAEERFTKFTYFQYGSGKLHILEGENFKSYDCEGIKKLYNLSEYINMNVVCQATENSRFISFNPWRKDENWNGRMIDSSEKIIKSEYDYSCIVCFEDKLSINNQEVSELSYVDLRKGIEYNIQIPENCYAAIFELCS